MAKRVFAQQGYRSCLGILRLGERYGNDRLEVAAARAGAMGARSYRQIDSILKHGLDRVALVEATQTESLSVTNHENVRGKDYYN